MVARFKQHETKALEAVKEQRATRDSDPGPSQRKETLTPPPPPSHYRIYVGEGRPFYAHVWIHVDALLYSVGTW